MNNRIIQKNGRTVKYILMYGTTAVPYAKYIYDSKGESLLKRWSKIYMSETKRKLDECMETFSAKLPALKELLCSQNLELFEINSKEGVFQALYRLGQNLGSGLEVQLDSIPIMQQVIELCELADVNPYEMDSCGAGFIVTENIFVHKDYFQNEEIELACIGRLTGDNGRIIRNGEETRFLTPHV